MTDLALNVLAFVFRSMALVCLAILSNFFRTATGPMVKPFRQLFWALMFLLAWVEVASVAELIGYINSAHAVVELSINWIFIPNLVITVALMRLLLHLRQSSARKKKRD